MPESMQVHNRRKTLVSQDPWAHPYESVKEVEEAETFVEGDTCSGTTCCTDDTVDFLL